MPRRSRLPLSNLLELRHFCGAVPLRPGMSFWRGVGVATLCTLGASFYVVGEVVEFKPPFAFDPTMESLPPMRTCASGSPAANRPFCNQGKTHDERAQLLAEDLTQVRPILSAASTGCALSFHLRQLAGGAHHSVGVALISLPNPALEHQGSSPRHLLCPRFGSLSCPSPNPTTPG